MEWRHAVSGPRTPVATCFAGKDDLQALMVGAGWEWAYTAFSDRNVDAERRQRAVLGEWRALKRAER
jgi:endonuclease YncB( thermonuclease family)